MCYCAGLRVVQLCENSNEQYQRSAKHLQQIMLIDGFNWRESRPQQKLVLVVVAAAAVVACWVGFKSPAGL
jgi:hypothetical protein